MIVIIISAARLAYILVTIADMASLPNILSLTDGHRFTDTPMVSDMAAESIMDKSRLLTNAFNNSTDVALSLTVGFRTMPDADAESDMTIVSAAVDVSTSAMGYPSLIS